ncbi:kinesin-like protein KIF12 isoform X3 [Hydra vulgaris]|uniref:Kinesin-like protein n=1 Tax=Hydra vulgaris TaxID=6087 RepID=A0ABM4CQU6_HYDVU
MTELNKFNLNQLEEKQDKISNSINDGSIFRPDSSSSKIKNTIKESTSFQDEFVMNNMVSKRKLTADIPFYMKAFDTFQSKVAIESSKDFSLPLLSDKQRKSCSTITSTCASTSLSQSSSLAGASSNINVVVRVRPMVKKAGKKERSIIDYPGEGVLWIEAGFNQSKSFTFNSVFNESFDQETFFERSGIIELIDKALCGYSCTVFAFGATGSGKTHTITGPQDQKLEIMLKDNEKYGIIPRSFKYLFEQIKLKTDIEYSIKASFLEIYNEKVKDLINTSNQNSLPVRWCSKDGFYAENLTKVECRELNHLFDVLSEGSAMRQVGQHLLNDYSSRSHSMLILFLDGVEHNSNVIKHGKINFVDLAGSERVKISKSAGKAFVESSNINKSLLTLGNCISALGDLKNSQRHIPYRDSKLTKLLTDALGGDGYTLMIACISPAFKDFHDSINTLRYANRAKNIKSKPIIKMDPKEQLILELKEKVKSLKAENACLREQFSETTSDFKMMTNPMQIKEFCCDDLLKPSVGSDSFSSFNSSDLNFCDQISFDSRLRATTAICALGARNGLYEMIQEYMNENERLKAENMKLYHNKSLSQEKRDQVWLNANVNANEILSENIHSLGQTNTIILPKIQHGYPNIVSKNQDVIDSEKLLHERWSNRQVNDINALQLTYNKMKLHGIKTSNQDEVNKHQCKKIQNIDNKQQCKRVKSIENKQLFKKVQRIENRLCSSVSADKLPGYAAKFAFRQEMCQNSKRQYLKDYISLPESINTSPISVGYPNHTCGLYYYGSKSAESFTNKTDQLHFDLEFLLNQIRAEVLQNKKNTGN